MCVHVWGVTRQMIIIVGVSLMCMARHGMLSKRVGSVHARKHYMCVSFVQNVVCTCCALCTSVKKGLCKVTGEKTDVHESQGWQHQQEAHV